MNCFWLLESVGIADTGADIAACDNMLRNILGREPLQDATVNIHGCTGTSNNKNKDKLRIVTSDKEVTVIEQDKYLNWGTVDKTVIHLSVLLKQS